MEGYDDLGSHMVGQPTLRLENSNLTLPNARKIVLSLLSDNIQDSWFDYWLFSRTCS